MLVFKPALLHQVDQSHVDSVLIGQRLRNLWTERRRFAVTNTTDDVFPRTAKKTTLTTLQ